MQIPQKKLSNGFEMPIYGLGTWQIGGGKERNKNNNDEADIDAIRFAIESGITHIDTAETYAEGHTEQLVGEAIRSFDRKNIFLSSKVYTTNLAYNDVLRSAEGSLNRLRTNYLDLYLLHRYNPKIPLSETMRALDDLVKSGKVKHIGVCNFPVEKLQEAQSFTKNKIVCDQVHFNLKYREAEKRKVVEYCQKNDMFLVAWRPLQLGSLLEKSSILSEFSEKYKKTPAQVAINWLISQPHVVTISKTTTKEHLLENLGGVGWEMESNDVERLRKEFPNQESISNAVPLYY